MLEAKGEARGRVVISVEPRQTSQMCYAYGHIDSESRPDQVTFRCTRRGFELNAADHNIMKNMLKRALNG